MTTDDDDFVVFDGSGDGGIDIAYLKRTDVDAGSRDDDSEEGDTWYLVQSKYGTSFSGSDTIRDEGNKVITTLDGQNQRISEGTKQLLAKLDTFRHQASAADRIVLVFATINPIAQQDREALEDIKLIGRARVMSNFDVDEVSLMTIWESLEETEQQKLSVTLKGKFVDQQSGLLVGTVPLTDLFDFLRSYQNKTGNLDQLYEKNVRQFLGSRRKINKGIANTLNENPEKFGLYNNGITIVVSGYSKSPTDGIVTMNDPYIVNGCQTTRTIWQVLDNKINAGGTGHDTAAEAWKERASRGGVVTKIVTSDEAEITNITRFTNSQNSVREQDFIALHSGFQNWAAAMDREYGIFLEIQRGGTESQKAHEKQHPDQPKFTDYVYAFDLIKVYGAGWLGTPGLAFNKNAPFMPQGSVYERIVSREETEPAFGARDLYAAYKVKCAADKIGFGRNSDRLSRRQSRFLFYYIAIKMLTNVILLEPSLPPVSNSSLTDAVIKLTTPETETIFQMLCDAAVNAVDEYLTPGSANSAHNEDSFVSNHNSDLNGFLKSESLETTKHSPLLEKLLAIHNVAFGVNIGGDSSRRELAAKALISG